MKSIEHSGNSSKFIHTLLFVSALQTKHENIINESTGAFQQRLETSETFPVTLN